jgi:hypothetical protein
LLNLVELPIATVRIPSSGAKRNPLDEPMENARSARMEVVQLLEQSIPMPFSIVYQFVTIEQKNR